MKKHRITLCIMVCSIGMLFVSGCALYSRGIGIYEVPSFKKKFVKASSFYDYIVSINEKEKTFYTLQPATNGLILSLITFDGEIKSEEMIIISFPGYSIKNNFALSEDGKKIIYYDVYTKNLYLYDIQTSEKKVIQKNISSCGWPIKRILFLNTDIILVILSKDILMLPQEINRENNEIMLINTSTQRIISAKLPAKVNMPILPSDFSISMNKKYLAFLDSDSWDGKYYSIYVYNLLIPEFIEKVPSDFFGSYVFSPDEKTLALIKDDNINLYSLETGQMTKVKQLPEGYSCYHVDFLDNNTIVYLTQKLGGGLSSTQNIITLDIQTGKEVKSPSIPINGDIYVVDGGKKILCEEGY
jgi:WD40 repeat protein